MPALPNATLSAITLIDHGVPANTLQADVHRGLTASPKTLPSKYFYDEEGSRLFDAITELEAYYPTRTEMGIMEAHIGSMMEAIGARALLVEYGSGSSLKTRILLDHLPDLVGYVPIDISGEYLLATAYQLAERYPELTIVPIAADYTTAFNLPELAHQADNVVAYFPGSTIGNFTPDEAAIFLKGTARLVGSSGRLLIGVDLKKDKAVLDLAYDDPEGVTAAFNLNVLTRLNRELNADFDLEAFTHRAFYNEAAGRVEMHLVSNVAQTVTIGDESYAFEEGETIHTENSYKYALGEFADLAAQAGFGVEHVWTDANDWFSVQLLRVQ
ncbi:MAG: L-histidine N(alpha)-methyltransferase [Rhodothermales bacterium]